MPCVIHWRQVVVGRLSGGGAGLPGLARMGCSLCAASLGIRSFLVVADSSGAGLTSSALASARVPRAVSVPSPAHRLFLVPVVPVAFFFCFQVVATTLWTNGEVEGNRFVFPVSNRGGLEPNRPAQRSSGYPRATSRQ